MREIEFRAWNGREMRTDFTLDAEDGMARLINFSIHGSPCEAVPHWKIMQFTGLRDKNGVKIFEGDIIKDNQDKVGEVKYFIEGIASCGCCFAQFDGVGFTAYANSGDSFDGVYMSECTVIGNIHQHPHLLEQKK